MPAVLLAGGLLLLLSGTGHGGDAAEGERFVRRNCSYCHAIAAGPSPMAEAPPFASIARSKTLRTRGARLVTGKRVKMPSFAFTDEQAEDITAYLKSLAVRRVRY